MGSPLLFVFLSVHGSFHSPEECVKALTGTHRAGDLPPWMLFWEMPFSLLTLDFRTGNNCLLEICLCPGTTVVGMGPFSFAALTFASLPYLSFLYPSFFFPFFFFFFF